MDGTTGIGRSNQLFVSWAGPHRGKPVSKQHLSHWMVQVTVLAYSNQHLQPPQGPCAHSSRGLAASWLTFTQFYMLDVSAPCVLRVVPIWLVVTC